MRRIAALEIHRGRGLPVVAAAASLHRLYLQSGVAIVGVGEAVGV